MIREKTMNKLSKVFITLGIILIVISISMLIYNKFEDLNAGKQSKDVLEIIESTINDSNSDENNALDMINNNPSKEMETTNIKGYDYIGTIIIPKLNLQLPIMSEYDYNRLKISPCRYYGSIYTNDLIICGHSYKTHFRYLNKLKQKDLIIFTDVNNNNYLYEVLEIEVLESTDVAKMINNDYDLTLYTCTNGGIDRLAIRCNRVFENI